MAKFCSNCGAQCEDAANVCGTCGTAFEGAQVAAPTFDAPVSAEAQSNKKLGVIAVAAVAVIAAVVILLVVLLGGGGYKKPVKQYMDGFIKADAEKILNVCSDYVMDQADEEDVDLEDSLQDMLDMVHEMAEEKDEDYKITYSIEDAEVFKGDDMEDEMEDLGIDDPDDVIDDYKITALAKVEVNVVLEVDDDEDDNDIDLWVCKEDGKWKFFYGGL